MTLERLRKIVIAAVAAHSLVLGAVMLIAPAWMLKMTGWQYEGPSFFPAQSGLFLMILGGGYAAALWSQPFAWFLVASKAAAIVFLVAEYVCGNGPLTLLPVAAFDGLMGLAVALVVVGSVRAQRGRDS